MRIKEELLYALPILILIAAIGFSPSVSFGKIPNGHLLEVRAEDIVIVFLALYWLKSIFIDKQKIAKPALFLPITLWLGFLLATTVFNVFLGNISAANGFFYYGKEVEFFFIYFFIYCHVATPANVKRSLLLCAAIALIHAGWIIFQIVFGLKITYYYSFTTFIEPSGTSPGGMFLLILFAFLFSAFLYDEYFRQANWPVKRAAMGFAAASPVVGIITSGSRGTFLAFVATLVVMVFLLIVRKVNPAGIWMVAGSIIICVTTLTAGYLFPSADILNRSETFRVFRSESMLHSLDSNNSNSRPALWKFNLERAAEKPMAFLFTGGGKSFSYEQQPHNYYLHAFNEGGFIGLSLFLFLLCVILAYAWNGFMGQHDRLTVGLSAGLIAATFGMMVSSLFAESFQVVKSAEIYWVFAALTLFAAPRVREEKPESAIL